MGFGATKKEDALKSSFSDAITGAIEKSGETNTSCQSVPLINNL